MTRNTEALYFDTEWAGAYIRMYTGRHKGARRRLLADGCVPVKAAAAATSLSRMCTYNFSNQYRVKGLFRGKI